ncbi:MAG: hypothetical protein KKA07_05575, partial [Bacteroidetes bacterium]|nr:hypothetical protein [Bacteroidota bacterium]
NTMRTTITALIIAISVSLQAQTVLNRIGQTPGGSAYHVNYDSTSQRLFVGCGTSMCVYDMANPAQPVILAKRPFVGLINESILDNGVLFIAATHDGIYALDANSSSLDILAHYDVSGLGDIGAYDMCMTGDTILIADKFWARRIKYVPGTGFVSAGANFSPWGTFCIAQKGNYIATGIQGGAKINIFDKSNYNTVVASWTSPKIITVQNIKFSDAHDNIIYVCGGPTDLMFHSNLFVLELNGTQLTAIDSFEVTGFPPFAIANITGIDTRNDTIYLATTAAIDTAMGLPLTYSPILDASGLPGDSLKMIGYLNQGLWHFDVSLMRGTPYLATSSEWLGVIMNDITTGNPGDTIPLIPTGGWAQNAKVRGDTLWVAHEGWGLAAYKIDSLLYDNGFMTNSIILHLYSQQNHFFVADMEFLNDTLLLLSSGVVYNLKPWLDGGQPDSLYKLKCSGIVNQNAYTASAHRLVVGSEFLGLDQKM